jgi:IS5 family transposase
MGMWARRNCIAKGKEHKEYEFGTKVSITSGINSGVIMSAYYLEKNDYDGHTLSRTLEQIKRLFGTVPKRLVADRGQGIRSMLCWPVVRGI